jgi:CRISPR-associated endonuclease/helicase Cas3
MNMMPNFSTFFEALWNYEPFPWQTMLVERISQGEWPSALDLPTASGKTACIDAAVYALALQAETPVSERTASRRIWFVVDRRIVVDEAYDRAATIADKLARATTGPLKYVADRLRLVGGTTRPLAVGRLRGGILRDDGWSRLPSQPAVITSTVDQLGSRMLFRGYGRSHLAAPIFAGLAVHDSLIILDEAHCSVPFLQTMRSIQTYRGEAWAEAPLKTPFAFAVLSATPPPGIPKESTFPCLERETALDHPKLQQRLKASKPTELVVVKASRDNKEDPLVLKAADLAIRYVKEGGKRRVAVIVNRVNTAEEVAITLRARVEGQADVVLLTGRIRPLERDMVVARWKPFLKASSPSEPEKPILFVSTQCIEVGADFSFDALVTECASLDALRQRFGRLNRMGIPGAAPAMILIREPDVKDSESDPVYGASLSKTWVLLTEKATLGAEGGKDRRVIDFGFEAMDKSLSELENLNDYLAPKPDAPILLPAHLDLLCQTAPTPHPEPDIQLYLHGKDRGAPEVRVVWRADLNERDVQTWTETVALCPPTSAEMLAVPLYRFLKWLAKSDLADDYSDVEGGVSNDMESAASVRPFLVWRGRDRSETSRNAAAIRPNDVIVLPAHYDIAGLGQATKDQAFGEHSLDLWEVARIAAGHPPALRIQRTVLEPWLTCPPLQDLVTLAEDPAWEREMLQQGIDAVLNYEPLADDLSVKPPSWLLDLIRATRNGRFLDHPVSGVIAITRKRQSDRGTGEPDLFADDDDLTSALTPAGRSEVSLAEHSASVKYVVKRLAASCLPAEFGDLLQVAAYWHDVGKIDERFQILLRQGDELAAQSGEPLAKSADVPISPARRRAIREASGLPPNFRHEMLSLQLAERHAPLPEDAQAALILHLIASHHGHARPFAPISPDTEPPDAIGYLGNIALRLSAEDRRALIPPHRLDSGLSERFWQLTRRYGWWGLAYLEAILRLGDWYGSEFIITEEATPL